MRCWKASSGWRGTCMILANPSFLPMLFFLEQLPRQVPRVQTWVSWQSLYTPNHNSFNNPIQEYSRKGRILKLLPTLDSKNWPYHSEICSPGERDRYTFAMPPKIRQWVLCSDPRNLSPSLLWAHADCVLHKLPLFQYYLLHLAFTHTITGKKRFSPNAQHHGF